MAKKWIGFGIVLAVFLFLVARAEKDELKLVSVEEAAAMLKTPDTFAMDANSKEVFEKAHIPDARWIKFRSYEEKELPPNKEAKLIFYCKNQH